MTVPNYLQPYLASYDISKINLHAPRFAHEFITEILNKGDMKSAKWIFANYQIEVIKSVIQNPSRSCWLELSLNYWVKILGVNISDDTFTNAIADNKLSVRKATLKEYGIRVFPYFY